MRARASPPGSAAASGWASEPAVRGDGVATGPACDERCGVTGTETSETAGVTAPLLSIRVDLAARAALARGARSAGTAHTAESPTAASDPSLL